MVLCINCMRLNYICAYFCPCFRTYKPNISKCIYMIKSTIKNDNDLKRDYINLLLNKKQYKKIKLINLHLIDRHIEFILLSKKAPITNENKIDFFECIIEYGFVL